MIFAGSFVAAYAPASTNGGKYAQEVTNYDNQLGAVVLKQALSHWNDIAIENSTLVMSEYTRNATLQWKAPNRNTYRKDADQHNMEQVLRTMGRCMVL